MKYTRKSGYFLKLERSDIELYIIKDHGSMGRSKPFYCIEVNGKVVMHGFGTQKEAKKYVKVYPARNSAFLIRDFINMSRRSLFSKKMSRKNDEKK